MSLKQDTEPIGYVLRAISLGPDLNKKNRELTKLIAAANERIKTIPNPTIMFNQIILLESKGSSEIENIITTDDELYKELIDESPKENNASKTLRIRSAVKFIAKKIDEQGIIMPNDIVEVGKTINGNSAGFRPTPGTVIRNTTTNEVIHTPPQSKEKVQEHINELLKYLNEGGKNDPITDTMLLHHAFEWIHPFIDGNGRTGRILIGAFLKQSKETDHIFLPISYFINKKKEMYYGILRDMTDNQDYEDYLSKMYGFMIDSAKFTLEFVRRYDENRKKVSEALFGQFNKYHEGDVIDCLFYNAYSTPTSLVEHLNLNYRTVKKIVEFLVEKKFFEIKKEGKRTYYINKLITGEINE